MSDRQSWLISLVAAALVAVICLGTFKAGVREGRAAAQEEAEAARNRVPGLKELVTPPTEEELEENARETLIGMQREFERMKHKLRDSQSEVRRLKEQLTSVSSLAKTK